MPSGDGGISKGTEFQRWYRDAAIAGGSGAAVTILVGLTLFLAGNVARILLDALVPTTRFLCASVMTATATVLALMLTLLSLSMNAEVKLKDVVYHRLKQIAFYDMLILVAATFFLVVHCVPVREGKNVPYWWYPFVYYAVLVAAALLAGGLVTVVVMLYAALRDMIHAFHLDGADHLVKQDAGETE